MLVFHLISIDAIGSKLKFPFLCRKFRKCIGYGGGKCGCVMSASSINSPFQHFLQSQTLLPSLKLNLPSPSSVGFPKLDVKFAGLPLFSLFISFSCKIAQSIPLLVYPPHSFTKISSFSSSGLLRKTHFIRACTSIYRNPLG